jgi:hypothetical protein
MSDNGTTTLDDLARMTAEGFERTATKDDIKDMATKADLDALREDITKGIDVLLDKHLGTYMERYDQLAHRVKRLEQAVGIDR